MLGYRLGERRWGRRSLRRRGSSPAKVSVVTISVVVSLGEGVADEGVEALEVGPRGDIAAVGLHDLGLLDLVLLLGCVDAILALNVGASELSGGGVDGVDGVGDLLPVLLTEVAAVELKVVGPPGINQRPGCFLGPAVLAARESRGPGRRRRGFRRRLVFCGRGRGWRSKFVVVGDGAVGGGGGGRGQRRGGCGL